MNLPQTFISNILHAFPEKGKTFLAELPQLIEIASKQWELTEINAVSGLSYNFVAFAKRHDEDVILKIGVLGKEVNSEVAALMYFNGGGAVKLFEHDPEHSMFLLERLRPGKMLVTLEDDDQCTEIAADLMVGLRKPLQAIAPAIQNQLTKLTDWFDELKELRPMFDGGTGPFPQKLIERFEETLPRLYAESSPPCLIHGDCQHFNILSSERGWVAIDPKGVIGQPEYEVGPLMINPWPSFLNRTNPRVQAERRLDILSERLGFPRKRLKDWAMCQAVLSSWWQLKPDGTGGEYSLRCAELFASL